MSGAGTLASILGIFFAIYARQNGRATREFIGGQNREIREFIAGFITAQNKEMREFIAAQNQDMREFLAKVLERLSGQVSQEVEKTREEIRRMRQSSG